MVVPLSPGGRLELADLEGVTMSNLIVPDDSKMYMLDVINQTNYCNGIGLFKNNYTPTHATVFGSLTDADFGGYVQGALANGVVSGSLDASFRGVITWDDVTFTRTSSPDNTIYGYYVLDSIGRLLWVERFDNPIVVDTNGIFIKLTPKLTDKSEFLNT